MVKENQRLFNRINMFTDILLLFVSMAAAYLIRFHFFTADNDYIKILTYMRFTFFIVPLHLIIYSFLNLYGSFRSKTFLKECQLIFNANTIQLAIILSVMFIFKMVDISRWLMVIFYLVNLVLILVKRLILRTTLSKARERGYNLKSVIILGAGEVADEYYKVIQNKKNFGYSYLGFVAKQAVFQGNKLGNYSDLFEILTLQKPDEVVCAIDIEDARELQGIVSTCEKTGTKISIIPFCYKFIPSQPYIDQIDNIPLINLRRIPLDNVGKAFLKRAMDIVGSFLLLLLTSPFMLIAAIGIKLTSPGPIIFKQKRVGLNKKNFTMYKFRSMRVNEKQDTGWSKNTDPRKTKFGSFLRKFSIDELPQFFNVLKGDMSLVGPRPELPFYVENFQKDIPLYMVKHQVKPGITGLAQVRGFRGDTSIEKRIECDIEYIENWNLFMDISILLKTAFKAFKNDEKLQIK